MEHVQLSLSRPYCVLFLRPNRPIRQQSAARSSFLSSWRWRQGWVRWEKTLWRLISAHLHLQSFHNHPNPSIGICSFRSELFSGLFWSCCDDYFCCKYSPHPFIRWLEWWRAETALRSLCHVSCFLAPSCHLLFAFCTF